jgi:HAD superfamily hydrolase (TIGR01509 family)
MQLTQELANVLKGKQVLIFDFDGTIADTSPLHAAAFESVLSPLGLNLPYSSIAGMKTADAMVFCAKTCGQVLTTEKLNSLVTAKQRLVREMMGIHLVSLPGVDRFLKWAKQHYRLSVATSGSRQTVESAMEKLGYAGWFDPLICSDDVERSKPYPDVFLKVLEHTKCRSDHALVFEDSEAGVMAAKNAGIAHIKIRVNSWITFPI